MKLQTSVGEYIYCLSCSLATLGNLDQSSTLPPPMDMFQINPILPVGGFLKKRYRPIRVKGTD